MPNNSAQGVFDLAAFPDWAEAHLKIIDEFGNLVTFTLNEVQRYIFTEVLAQYESLGRVDCQILKARQMGVSTLIQGILFYFMLHTRFRNALTIAHKDNSTQFIYNMQRIFYENCDIKPDYRKWNRAGIEFNNEDGSGLNNRIMVETAGSADIGRAFTLHFIHCSEVASWDKLVDKKIDVSGLFGGLNQSIRDRTGTFKFIESTAQGEGYFKQMWYDPPPSRINLFRSWVAMSTYRLDVTESQKEELVATTDRRYGDEYKEAEYIKDELRRWWPDCNIDHEVYCRLAWRRHIIRSTCEGKLHIFKQEYPTREQDAFASANFTAFDAFYLGERLTEVANRQTGEWLVPHNRLEFDSNEVDPENPLWWRQSISYSSSGDIVEFEGPDPNYKYCIGGDACYGTTQDEAAFVVWKLPHLVEVCSYHASIDADELGEMMFCVGMAYNKALLAVEWQGPGLSTIHRLEELHYPNLYRMKSLSKTNSKRPVMQHGFYSNRASKPLLAGIMRQCIRERRLTLNNPDFIGQLMAFHELRGGGSQKFEAAPGFRDDMVMAGAIGLYISGEIMPASEPKPETNPNTIAFRVKEALRAETGASWMTNR